MALVDVNKMDFYREKDTGLRLDTVNKDGSTTTQAILAMKQPGKPIKTKRHNQGWWPDEKRIEAATLFAALGNVKKVSEMTKIPEKTVFRWTQEEWWMQTITRVRREENATTDKKFTTIVDKALDKLMDRIDNGDMIYDIKRGVAVPVPVNARDLAIVTGTVFDKRQLLRGEATKITAAANSDEHLKKLAIQFEEFVKARTEKVIATQPAEDAVLKNNE